MPFPHKSAYVFHTIFFIWCLYRDFRTLRQYILIYIAISKIKVCYIQTPHHMSLRHTSYSITHTCCATLNPSSAPSSILQLISCSVTFWQQSFDLLIIYTYTYAISAFHINFSVSSSRSSAPCDTSLASARTISATITPPVGEIFRTQSCQCD